MVRDNSIAFSLGMRNSMSLFVQEFLFPSYSFKKYHQIVCSLTTAILKEGAERVIGGWSKTDNKKEPLQIWTKINPFHVL